MKKDLGILMLLIVVCAIEAFRHPAFLSAYNLKNNAEFIGEFGIFGIGLGIVIITGGIDLSVGSAFALLGVILAKLLVESHVAWPLAVGVVMLMGIVIGLVHAFLIAKVRMQSFIVTLCGLLIYRSLARYIANDEDKGFGTENYGMLSSIAKGHFMSIPAPFIVMLVVAVIMWIVLHRSVYGRYLFAVGRNEEAARYSGIRTRLVIGSAYVICLLLASLTAIILSFSINSVSPSDFGLSYEMYGIAAAVLGGCSLRGGEGSIFGIVIGTALLQVLQNIVNLEGIPSTLNGTVIGVVILLGVLVDQVLAQRRDARK